MRDFLHVNVYCVEYAGYGILKEQKPSAKQIGLDCICFVKYLIEFKQIPAKNMILMGKSIGTGFATYVASKIDVGGLILVSPFLSIRHIVKDFLGGFGAFFMKETLLNSQELIKKVTCPTLLIHGKKDGLISFKHSQILYENLNPNIKIKMIKIFPDMDHTNMLLYEH